MPAKKYYPGFQLEPDFLFWVCRSIQIAVVKNAALI
jgi:hypothetical protein